MRLINWNIERKKPASWQASSLMDEISSHSPDIVCLTEAHQGSTATLGGHEISARGVAWAANYAETERKVVLWSRHPWSEVEEPTPLGEIGGVVVGTTKWGSTRVRAMGVCIPYQHASPFGAAVRSKYFAEHNCFLKQLAKWFASQSADLPLLVTGDFNRGVPRDWGPLDSYRLLMETFSSYNFATYELEGPLRKKGVQIQRQTIDHIALLPRVRAKSVVALSALDPTRQKVRSDHFGVFAELEFSQNAACGLDSRSDG